MKIKRVLTVHAIIGLEYKMSFDNDHYNLSYSKDMNAILVNQKILIPMHVVQELHLEKEDEKKK